MGKGDDSSKISGLQKTVDNQANTIAKLENDMKKLGDVNATPRIIQKGNQRHPHFVKNKLKTVATITIETLTK